MRLLQLGLVAICCVGSFACSQRQAIMPSENYALAVNKKSNLQKTRYVPMALPGQLMPVKHSAPKASKKLVGIEATDAANKKALKLANSGEYINSITSFDYVSGVLYQIYTAPLKITDVQFQANEHIVAVGAGDTTRWQVSKTYSGVGASRHEHLLIKPIEDGLTNAIVVTTDKRTYHLVLESTPSTYMASVTWRYPDEDDTILTKLNDDSAPDTDDTDLHVDLDRINFNYTIKIVSGKRPVWLPTMVFHDGSKTYIRFASNIQEVPNLFVGQGRYLQVVNYRVQGDYFIIDRVIEKAQLRMGDGRQKTVVQISMNK